MTEEINWLPLIAAQLGVICLFFTIFLGGLTFLIITEIRRKPQHMAPHPLLMALGEPPVEQKEEEDLTPEEVEKREAAAHPGTHL